MQLPIVITSMTAYPQAKPVREHAVLGQMSVELGPLLVVGCVLARLDRGDFKVWMPSLGRNNRLVIRDHGERDRLLLAALKAYRALTGRDPAETPLAKASPTKDTFHDPA